MGAGGREQTKLRLCVFIWEKEMGFVMMNKMTTMMANGKSSSSLLNWRLCRIDTHSQKHYQWEAKAVPIACKYLQAALRVWWWERKGKINWNWEVAKLYTWQSVNLASFALYNILPPFQRSTYMHSIDKRLSVIMMHLVVANCTLQQHLSI